MEPADGPVPLRPPWSLLTWGALLMLPLLLAGAAVVWWRRQSATKPARTTPQSPRQWAQSELESLLSSDCRHSDIKRFYAQLTLIIRRYIERATGVHAAEQTTEEFWPIVRKAICFRIPNASDWLTSWRRLTWSSSRPNNQPTSRLTVRFGPHDSSWVRESDNDRR